MSKIKTAQTRYEERIYNERVIDKGLEQTLNEIGYENVLQILTHGEGSGCIYTIIYKGE